MGVKVGENPEWKQRTLIREHSVKRSINDIHWYETHGYTRGVEVVENPDWKQRTRMREHSVKRSMNDKHWYETHGYTCNTLPIRFQHVFTDVKKKDLFENRIQIGNFFKRLEFHLSSLILSFDLFIEVIFYWTLRVWKNVCAVYERQYPFEERCTFQCCTAKYNMFDKSVISGECTYPCTTVDMVEVLSQKKKTWWSCRTMIANSSSTLMLFFLFFHGFAQTLRNHRLLDGSSQTFINHEE